MLSLLNQFEHIVQTQIPEKDARDFLRQAIAHYKKCYVKYKDDNSYMAKYRGLRRCPLHDKHRFVLTSGNTIKIVWNVAEVYEYAQRFCSVQHLSFEELTSIIRADLDNSDNELDRISRIVKTPHSHEFDPLLIVHFKPMNCYILIDGRHRYIEYMKFNRRRPIPVYILDDAECADFILTVCSFVNYSILHNLYTIDKCLFHGESLLNLIDPEYFLSFLE